MNAGGHKNTHDAEKDDRYRDIKIDGNGKIVSRDKAKVLTCDPGSMLGDGM